MNEVYNLRVGDMLYHPQAIDGKGERQNSAIMAVVYKTTQKYVYYAICARAADEPSDHYITMDNRTKKESVYRSIQNGTCLISYSNGIKRRRKIENFS